jgi:hypothetical protein
LSLTQHTRPGTRTVEVVSATTTLTVTR